MNITVTLNGKTATLTREIALSQIAKSEAAIAAMTPLAEQAQNRHSTATEIAKAQAEQDKRRAMHAEIVSTLRAALGA